MDICNVMIRGFSGICADITFVAHGGNLTVVHNERFVDTHQVRFVASGMYWCM